MTKIKEIAESVSDAEIQILKALWQDSPLSAQEIISKLQLKDDVHPKTIKTLINRLLKKGALGFHEENRKYHYYPLIEKSDLYTLKTENFLDQFFNGELTPLVSFFSSQKKIDINDIAELKRLIEKMEEDHGS